MYLEILADFAGRLSEIHVSLYLQSSMRSNVVTKAFSQALRMMMAALMKGHPMWCVGIDGAVLGRTKVSLHEHMQSSWFVVGGGVFKLTVRRHIQQLTPMQNILFVQETNLQDLL